MDEYLEKLRKLPVERLEKLVKNYRVTIANLEARIHDANIVALNSVVDYSQQEVSKKRAELAIIEQILQEKKAEK